MLAGNSPGMRYALLRSTIYINVSARPLRVHRIIRNKHGFGIFFMYVSILRVAGWPYTNLCRPWSTTFRSHTGDLLLSMKTPALQTITPLYYLRQYRRQTFDCIVRLICSSFSLGYTTLLVRMWTWKFQKATFRQLMDLTLTLGNGDLLGYLV